MSATMFYDPSRFPFTRPLEQDWQRIREEYRGVRDHLVDWYEGKLYDEGWKVFTVFDFPHGRAIEENIRKCPFTAALVHEHVRHHGVAGFSVLKPKARIKPHRGYQGDFLRCHLGLEIPSGDCRLRVDDQVRLWEVGKVMVFDDRGPHEAWNMTDDERVILLIDFIPEA